MLEPTHLSTKYRAIAVALALLGVIWLVAAACRAAGPNPAEPVPAVASPVAATGTGTTADSGQPQQPAAKSVEAPESVLRWLVRALGPEFSVIFLFLTVNLVALMVMNVLAVSRENIMPAALLRGLDVHLRERQYPQACALLQADDSLLGRVLRGGIAKLPEGGDVTSLMEEMGSLEAMKLGQRLGYVALIAKISPMVGVLGTVHGMMTAFRAVAEKGAIPVSAGLASGMWTALVASLVGFWIAIFAAVFFHVVRNRLDKLLAEAGLAGDELIKRFASLRSPVSPEVP